MFKTDNAAKNTLLEVVNLKSYFRVPDGNLHAVDDVSFTIKRGTTLGIVGESGCGKSTLGRSVLRLLEPTSGEIWYGGENILDYDKKLFAKIRQEMQMIFQDPYGSLNPRMTVRELIQEPIIVNRTIKSKKDIQHKVQELMERVGLANRLINSYPHELDGGRRQRIGIARALALDPKFIVCDEPVSALDVSIQAQILNLLMDLQDDLGLTYMFITHDLSVVRHISDEIIVMYLGKCVERAPSEELFRNPLHPYTKALLEAIPVPELVNDKNRRIILKGEVVSPINPEPGCRFAARCNEVKDGCIRSDTKLKEVSKNHFVSCMKYVGKTL